MELKRANQKRSFSIVSEDDQLQGCYYGRRPVIAAQKAFSRILKQNSGNPQFGKDFVMFTIIETTQGSKNTKYNYRGKISPYWNAQTVKFRNGKTVTFTKNNDVRNLAYNDYLDD